MNFDDGEEPKFENHILVELDILSKFYPHPLNQGKLKAYTEELLKLDISSDCIKSFVRHHISTEKQFPSYSEILTYLDNKKCIGSKNKSTNYPACKLCGNSQRKGMWVLTRDDGYEVAAICICNDEQSKTHYFRYDPNQPNRPNGNYRYLKAVSFDYQRTPDESSF